MMDVDWWLIFLPFVNYDGMVLINKISFAENINKEKEEKKICVDNWDNNLLVTNDIDVNIIPYGYFSSTR